MNKKLLEQQIKDHLLQETEVSTDQKEETWNKIETELFSSKKKKYTKKYRWRLAVGFAALVFLVVFGSSTDMVQGMIENIKSLFVEEKQQEIELEGMKEEENVQLEVNQELNYVIYFDHDRYKLEEGESGDRIVPIQELEERYPEVSMEIIKESNTSTEEVVERIKQEMDGLEIRAEEKVSEPMESISIRAIKEGESNWNTPVYQWYITPTEEEQVFVIKQSYFLEAAEGHGVRFDYILESFEIVKE